MADLTPVHQPHKPMEFELMPVVGSGPCCTPPTPQPAPCKNLTYNPATGSYTANASNAGSSNGNGGNNYSNGNGYGNGYSNGGYSAGTGFSGVSGANNALGSNVGVLSNGGLVIDGAAIDLVSATLNNEEARAWLQNFLQGAIADARTIAVLKEVLNLPGVFGVNGNVITLDGKKVDLAALPVIADLQKALASAVADAKEAAEEAAASALAEALATISNISYANKTLTLPNGVFPISDVVFDGLSPATAKLLDELREKAGLAPTTPVLTIGTGNPGDPLQAVDAAGMAGFLGDEIGESALDFFGNPSNLADLMALLGTPLDSWLNAILNASTLSGSTLTINGQPIDLSDLAVAPENLTPGTIAPGVELPADQVAPGTLGAGVLLPADQVAPGTFGPGVLLPAANIIGPLPATLLPPTTVATAYDALTKEVTVTVDGVASVVSLGALDDEGTKLVLNAGNVELQNDAGTVLGSIPVASLDAQTLTLTPAGLSISGGNSIPVVAITSAFGTPIFTAFP